ncbi:MAG: thiolase family protein, partial [Variovorax paradoxus]|nr:thiolase family protein [Variovorax paradoxus]
MTKRRLSYEGVAVAVPITVPYVRYSTRTAHWFIGQAIEALVEASGVAKEQIDGLCLSSFSLAPDTAVGVTQHLGLSPRWLDHVPTGGASGVMCLRRAARAVQAGDADIVACVGADTNHVDSFRQTLGSFSNFARDASYPYGSISDPIHLFDCVMPCAGADAFLVMSEERARDLGLAHVVIRGAIERHNAYAEDPVMVQGGWRKDRDDLYAQAGIQPAELDFVQTYDDYPVI